MTLFNFIVLCVAAVYLLIQSVQSACLSNGTYVTKILFGALPTAFAFLLAFMAFSGFVK